MVKYHKIRNVDKHICTVEQKIAYNIAFTLHINIEDQYRKLLSRSVIAAEDFLYQVIQMEINSFKVNYPNSRYDIDGIFSALRAGLADYLMSDHHIFSDYKECGKAFPAYYLSD